MSGRDWTDRIVGDRMAVDREFNDRVVASQFSRQEWGLIMTAVEFEIENPEHDERARLIADTEKLPAVIPELDRISSQADRMSAPGTERGDADASGRSSGNGGVLDSIKRAFGLGSGNGKTDNETIEAADRLAREYATRLQRHLESNGKWEDIRAGARE